MLPAWPVPLYTHRLRRRPQKIVRNRSWPHIHCFRVNRPKRDKNLAVSRGSGRFLSTVVNMVSFSFCFYYADCAAQATTMWNISSRFLYSALLITKERFNLNNFVKARCHDMFCQIHGSNIIDRGLYTIQSIGWWYCLFYIGLCYLCIFLCFLKVP